MGFVAISSTNALADPGQSLPVQGSRERTERPSGIIRPREPEPDSDGSGWDAKKTAYGGN